MSTETNLWDIKLNEVRVFTNFVLKQLLCDLDGFDVGKVHVKGTLVHNKFALCPTCAATHRGFSELDFHNLCIHGASAGYTHRFITFLKFEQKKPLQ